jgi:hypothetical protein
MRSPTEKAVSGGSADRRKTERRGVVTKGAQQGENRVVEQRGMAHAMVDALEDILKYERASERALRVGEQVRASSPDVSN